MRLPRILSVVDLSSGSRSGRVSSGLIELSISIGVATGEVSYFGAGAFWTSSDAVTSARYARLLLGVTAPFNVSAKEVKRPANSLTTRLRG